MFCPKCGADTRVIETDKMAKAVIRLRRCRNEDCGFHFETSEITSSVLRRQRETLKDAPARDGAAQAGFSRP